MPFVLYMTFFMSLEKKDELVAGHALGKFVGIKTSKTLKMLLF